MGLCINYKGRLSPQADLSELITEVKDMAEVYGWKYFIFDEKFPDKAPSEPVNTERIYGICFTPPECETVHISFLENRQICSIASLRLFENESEERRKELTEWVFVKTQFAGIEIHKILIHLFRYLSDKYFIEFEMMDEGQYWETDDEKVLEENFARYNFLLNTLVIGLESFPKEVGESFEDYFARLMQWVKAKDSSRKKEGL